MGKFTTTLHLSAKSLNHDDNDINPSIDLSIGGEFLGPGYAKEYISQTWPLRCFDGAIVKFDSHLKDRLDTCGLFLELTKVKGPPQPPKWVKIGLIMYPECFYSDSKEPRWDRIRTLTAACNTWPDWNVAEVPKRFDQLRTIAYEIRRETDLEGYSLWVYQEAPAGDLYDDHMCFRNPLRVIRWFFAEEEGWEVRLGGYASRRKGTEPLEATLHVTVKERNLEGCV